MLDRIKEAISGRYYDGKLRECGLCRQVGIPKKECKVHKNYYNRPSTRVMKW